MQLNAEELRILGCLIEKDHTTPEQYPLSTNSLRLACNQKTSREPVVDYSTSLIDSTVLALRDGGWARSVRGSGSRTVKHKHVVDEKLGLSESLQAVLAVLMLRGPQSVGELKSRTQRFRIAEDPAAIEQALSELDDRQLARNIGRKSGQSQDRWEQLLGSSAEIKDSEAGNSEAENSETQNRATSDSDTQDFQNRSAPPPAASAQSHSDAPIDQSAIDDRLAALERRVAILEQRLGS